jgi:DNA-binding transcriptional regulator YiaG
VVKKKGSGRNPLGGFRMAYKSEIYEAVHQDATAMFEIGAISEAKMREFDEMCLVQEPETARPAENPLNKIRSLFS